MKKEITFNNITKTIILSLFVLFFGVIYVVFVKTDEYSPSDLLETYIVETENKYYKVNQYSGFGTYETDFSLLDRSTNSNIVSIEMYVFCDEIVEEDNKETAEIEESTKTIENIQIVEDTNNEKTTNINKNNLLVDINTATAEELDTLPKIGPSIANAIIKYREKYGPFKSIDQIKNVTGIGDKIFQSIKDLITV